MSLLMEALRKAEEEKEQQPEGGFPHQGQDDQPEEEDSLLVLDLPDLPDTPVAPVTFEVLPEQAGDVEEETEAPAAPREDKAVEVSKPESPPSLEADLDHEAETSVEVETEQQMAQALFQARARSRKHRFWLGLLMAVALTCLAVLVGWYFMVIKVEQGVPLVPATPQAVNHDAGGPDVSSAPVTGVAGTTGPGEGNGRGTGSDMKQASEAKPVMQQEAPLAKEKTGPVTSQQAESSVNEKVPSGNPVKVALPANSQSKADPSAAPMTAEAAYRRAMDRMAGGKAGSPAIQIRRSTRKTGKNSPVRRAWQAFKAGRYPEADRLYAAVLAQEPYNRDALLGRAAVAVATGKPRVAQDFYLRLLERDPRDPLAQAGMVSLQGRRQPVEAIARVQQLIAANPDLGGLNFILGNLYAAQKRWSYAQQAYFRAHVSDPENPDYLFNLAVSLDHLGKERQALEFYRRALQQAERHEARFQAETVSRRIQALAGGEGRQP